MACLFLCLSPSWAQGAESEPDLSELLGSLSQAPVEFKARASKGYSIRVEGAGRRVTLSASGPAGTATYVVKGSVSRKGITANFGKRGRVDVRFRPSRRKKIETAPNRCKGKPHVTRWGVFVGTIRFAGERGYTRLRAGRASGRTNATPRWKCKRRRGGSQKPEGAPGPPVSPDGEADSSEEAIVLEIANRRTGMEAGAALFEAGGQKLAFSAATAEERRGRMRISRYNFDFSSTDAFSFDDSLSTATLGPSGPFSGVATFRRNADGSMTGTGSLSVVLPGMRRASLVGPGNRVRLYRLSEDGIARPGQKTAAGDA